MIKRNDIPSIPGAYEFLNRLQSQRPAHDLNVYCYPIQNGCEQKTVLFEISIDVEIWISSHNKAGDKRLTARRMLREFCLLENTGCYLLTKKRRIASYNTIFLWA